MSIEITNIAASAGQVSFDGTKFGVTYKFVLSEKALRDLARFDINNDQVSLAVFNEYKSKISAAAEKIMDDPDKDNNGKWIISSNNI